MRRYYDMNNAKLEEEASRYKIGEYGNVDGTISRERIISQLIARDAALEVPKASLRSWISLAISVISLLVSIYVRH